MKRLVLRFEEGPLAGREFSFAPAANRIVLGTAPACDVRWPDDAAGIGSEHCEFVRDAGRYEIRVNREDGVWIEGARAHDGQEIQPGARLSFGRIDTHRAVAHYEAVSLGRAWIERARRHPAAWTVVVVAALGLAVLGGVAGSRGARNEPAVPPPSATVPAQPETPWSDVVARVQPSVYLVLIKSDAGQSAVGTAWVASNDQLATNAHVALMIGERLQGNPGQRVIVRSAVAPFDEWQVVGVRIHPAFPAFASASRAYRPTRVESDGEPKPVDVGFGYDVALLRVAPTARLGPPLQRADTATLQKLRPGEAVAYVGFPLERLLEADLAQPSPRSQTGSVVSITNFTMTHAAPGTGQRIEHSLPATGGASGSPIFNRNGQVVAVLSGGNIIAAGDGERAPSAALVNFAQRVDLLEPLLAAPRDGIPLIDMDRLRREWQQDFSRYDTPEQAADKHMAQLVARWARASGFVRPPPPFTVEQLSGPWMRLPDGRVVIRKELRLSAGRHFIAAVGRRERELRGSAFLGGVAQGRIVAQDISDDYYPVMRLQLENDARVDIEIEDTLQTDPTKAEPVELRWVTL